MLRKVECPNLPAKWGRAYLKVTNPCGYLMPQNLFGFWPAQISASGIWRASSCFLEAYKVIVNLCGGGNFQRWSAPIVPAALLQGKS